MRTELKVEGSLLRSISKAARAYTGYGLSERRFIFDNKNYGVVTIKTGGDMADLFKDFQDWLGYNHPEVKLEPLQEDLMRIALRNWSNKVPKAARKAILKELAQQIMTKGAKKQHTRNGASP